MAVTSSTAKVDNNRSLSIKSNFSNLSHSLISHVFSFLHEMEIANMAGCHPNLHGVKIKNDKTYRENQLIAWEKILGLSPKIIPVKEELSSLSISPKDILWKYTNELYIYNVSQQSIIWIPCMGKKIEGGPLDERVSVYVYDYGVDLIAAVIDNVTHKQLNRIVLKFPKPEDIISVFGTQKLNQPLEFVTVYGNLLICDYHIPSTNEMDRKSDAERQKDPIRVKQAIDLCSSLTSKNEKLKRAYKIKESYYFIWDRSITFMKDNKLPQQQVKIEDFKINKTHTADDKFFYSMYENVLTIYKLDKVWQRCVLNISNPDSYSFRNIYPSNGGLVIEEILYKDLSCESTLSFLNYRKKNPEIFRIGESCANVSPTPIFILKNVLVFKNKDYKWTFHYIPLNKKIVSLDLDKREIFHIMAGENQFFPVHLVIHHSDHFFDHGRKNVHSGENPQLDVYSLELDRVC